MSDTPKRRKKVSTPSKTVTPKADKPTFASKCRRKAALIAEVKSESIDPTRKDEIYAIINGELADIPSLSYAELQRLGA